MWVSRIMLRQKYKCGTLPAKEEQKITCRKHCNMAKTTYIEENKCAPIEQDI